MKYINEICNGCGKRFTENDDIVVCPECGTPQHRECWLKEHECVNEQLHEDGFEWRPKHSQAEEAKQNIMKKPCPFCGHENPVDSEFCENCSQPLSLFGRNDRQNGNAADNAEEYAYKPPFKVDYEEPVQQNNTAPNTQPFMPAQPIPFNVRSDMRDQTILGEQTKDFASYIRISISSYYKKFKKFESGKKVLFNFAAFLFGPLWFFFRKLYKAGIVLMAVSVCITMLFYEPITKVYEPYMTEISAIWDSEEKSSSEKMEAIMEKSADMTEKNGALIYGFLGSSLALNISSALLADILYKNKFLKDMKEVSEEANGSDERRRILIFRRGGISMFAPIAARSGMNLLTSLLMKVFFE